MPWTRSSPRGSVAGSRYRRDMRFGGASRAGGGGTRRILRIQGSCRGEVGGTTSPARRWTWGVRDRGRSGMLGIQGAGVSRAGTRPRARRTAACTATPDSGVCRASSPSSFAGSLLSRTCHRTRGPAASNSPFDHRRFPWWAPSGNSRSGTGCASRCSANLSYPSRNTETWCWWNYRSLPGSAACPGSRWWPLQSEPRRSTVASAGSSRPAHLWLPAPGSWSWCPQAALFSPRTVIPLLRPWSGGSTCMCRAQKCTVLWFQAGQTGDRCSLSTHRCILSYQFPTVLVKFYWLQRGMKRWTMWNCYWHKSHCFNLQHPVTGRDINLLVEVFDVHVFKKERKMFAAHRDLLIIKTHLTFNQLYSKQDNERQ